jgi:ParB-like chromosome segregation protein Spo0J
MIPLLLKKRVPMSDPSPQVIIVAADQISFNAANPRVTPATDEDDAALLRAIRDNEREPYLTQLPGATQQPDGSFLIEYGARRVRACLEAGWQSVAVLAWGESERETMHRRRLLENMHRVPLHPLDLAAAIRWEWLLANAAALGLAEAVRPFHLRQEPLGKLVGELEAWLAEHHGFMPRRPQVLQQDVIAELGLDISSAQLRRYLQLLNLDYEHWDQVREMELNEAQLRSLSSIPQEAQAEVVAALTEQPELAQRLRRVSNALRTEDYTVDDALAEARGDVSAFLPTLPETSRMPGAPWGSMPWEQWSDADPEDEGTEFEEETADEGDDTLMVGGWEEPPSGSSLNMETIQPLIIEMMDASANLVGVMYALQSALNGRPIQSLPQPHQGFVLQVLEDLRRQCASLGDPL